MWTPRSAVTNAPGVTIPAYVVFIQERKNHKHSLKNAWHAKGYDWTDHIVGPIRFSDAPKYDLGCPQCADFILGISLSRINVKYILKHATLHVFGRRGLWSVCVSICLH